MDWIGWERFELMNRERRMMNGEWAKPAGASKKSMRELLEGGGEETREADDSRKGGSSSFIRL